MFLTPVCPSPVCPSPVCPAECNCHNKAVDCFYNQTVSELFLSLNTRGVRRGGGVCINCQQNTAGVNCETCIAGYYRPAEVLTNTSSNYLSKQSEISEQTNWFISALKLLQYKYDYLL